MEERLHDALLELVISTDLLRHSVDELNQTFKQIEQSKDYKKQIFEAIGADEISALF